jgi:hypothetical protein
MVDRASLYAHHSRPSFKEGSKIVQISLKPAPGVDFSQLPQPSNPVLAE